MAAFIKHYILLLHKTAYGPLTSIS